MPFLRCFSFLEKNRKPPTNNPANVPKIPPVVPLHANPRRHACTHFPTHPAAPRINLRVRARSQEACAKACVTPPKNIVSQRAESFTWTNGYSILEKLWYYALVMSIRNFPAVWITLNSSEKSSFLMQLSGILSHGKKLALVLLFNYNSNQSIIKPITNFSTRIIIILKNCIDFQ